MHTFQCRFEDRAERQERVEAGRLSQVFACAKLDGVSFVVPRIRGTENDRGHVAALPALPQRLENFAPRLFWKVEVNDNEVGTPCWFRVQGQDEIDCRLAVKDDRQFASYAVLFEGFPDEGRVRGVVFDEQN